jgi:TolA-binding protein
MVFPVAVFSMLLVFSGGAWYLAFKAPEFPVVPFNRGLAHFAAGEFQEARDRFRYVCKRYPQTLIVDEAAYHLAMTYFRERDWGKTLEEIERLLHDYPETRRAAEAYYHAGLCSLELDRVEAGRHWFKRAIDEFPGSVWAGFAAERVGERR